MAFDKRNLADLTRRNPPKAVTKTAAPTAPVVGTGTTNPAAVPKKSGLAAMGYTGPMPGTPAFKAARAAGETPIRTFMQTRRAAKKATRAASMPASSASAARTRPPGFGRPTMPVPGRPIPRPATMKPPVPLPVKPMRPNLATTKKRK